MKRYQILANSKVTLFFIWLVSCRADCIESPPVISNCLKAAAIIELIILWANITGIFPSRG